MPGGVVHLKKAPFDVLIDRSTPWGNPFTHLDLSTTKARWNVGTRQESLEAFEWWVENSEDPEAAWIREHVGELADKTLGCWCSPRACHGDVLLRLAAAAAPTPSVTPVTGPRDPDDKIKRRRIHCKGTVGKGKRYCPRCGWKCTHLVVAYWDSMWNEFGGMCGECCHEASRKFDREASWPPVPEDPEGEGLVVGENLTIVNTLPAPVEEQQGLDV